MLLKKSYNEIQAIIATENESLPLGTISEVRSVWAGGGRIMKRFIHYPPAARSSHTDYRTLRSLIIPRWFSDRN